MGFIVIPFDFVSSENAEKDSMGIPVPKVRGEMSINTNQISVYYGDDSSVTVRMSDGEDYSIPISIEEFESVLSEIEMICDLSKLIKEN